MKTPFKSILWIALVVGLGVGCNTKKSIEGSGDGSDLADVFLKMPTGAKITAQFGPNCSDVKLSAAAQSAADGKTGCAAILDLLSEYELTIDGPPSPCTSIKENKKVSANSKIVKKVHKGCNYNVLMKLGKGGVAYFSNEATSRSALTTRILRTAKPELLLVLKPTAAGREAGFGQDNKVITEPDDEDTSDVPPGEDDQTPPDSGNGRPQDPADEDSSERPDNPTPPAGGGGEFPPGSDEGGSDIDPPQGGGSPFADDDELITLPELPPTLRVSVDEVQSWDGQSLKGLQTSRGFISIRKVR